MLNCIVSYSLLREEIVIISLQKKILIHQGQIQVFSETCIVHSHCTHLCNDFSKGGALYFQIFFPVNVHAVDHDFHCLMYETCGATSSFQTISVSPFQSFSINKISIFLLVLHLIYSRLCRNPDSSVLESVTDKQSCCLHFQCLPCVLKMCSGLVLPAEFQCQLLLWKRWWLQSDWHHWSLLGQ